MLSKTEALGKALDKGLAGQQATLEHLAEQARTRAHTHGTHTHTRIQRACAVLCL